MPLSPLHSAEWLQAITVPPIKTQPHKAGKLYVSSASLAFTGAGQAPPRCFASARSARIWSNLCASAVRWRGVLHHQPGFPAQEDGTGGGVDRTRASRGVTTSLVAQTLRSRPSVSGCQQPERDRCQRCSRAGVRRRRARVAIAATRTGQPADQPAALIGALAGCFEWRFGHPPRPATGIPAGRVGGVARAAATALQRPTVTVTANQTVGVAGGGAVPPPSR
jgi:hypothetical protein